MAKQTVADFLISRLKEWGIQKIYGYPGDGINGIMGALNRADNDPEFILARHEEMAAFMACGHAKFTGQVGVCLATSGPGAIHLLNGLYDAKLDHQPVVAIVGQQKQSAMGGHYQQEIDLISVFKDVAGHYVQMVTVPEQFPDVIDRAIRIAVAERTVTCIIMPNDVQDLDYAEPKHEHGYVPGGLHYSKPRVIPPAADLKKAAEIINAGKKVGILIGQGARSAADEVIELADITGSGVAKALLGKDVLSDELPFVTGSIGLLGTKPSWDMIQNCDTFLMIGSNLPYSEFLPPYGKAKGIQIDIDGKMIGMRYPMDINLVGDAKETLRELLPLLKRKEDRKWREEIEKSVERWWKVVEARAMMDASPINPQRVFWELSSRLPDNVILTCDSGSAANWYARDLKFKPGMRGSLSGTLATMGCGMPYAIAAKMNHPGRPVLALVGDGAMQMNGINELITVSQYWKRWSDPRFAVMVLHNNDLNQVTWEMRVMEGDTKFEASQYIVDFPYAKYAESLGLKGIRLDKPEDIGAAWDEVLASDRPVLLEAITDPAVPPLPPHITIEQAKEFASSLMKGEPGAWDIIKQSFKGKLTEFMPKR
jgi:pyruvate dehydrogenase (quinone)